MNEPGFAGAMTISGGAGAFTIVSSTGLPNTLTPFVSGKMIKFTGTPTTVGRFANGSITVADSVGTTYTAAVSITIVAAPTHSGISATAWTANIGGFTGTVMHLAAAPAPTKSSTLTACRSPRS